MTYPATESQKIDIKAGSVTLSGGYRPADTPRALLFCIHGGSYTSHYFDFASQGDDTLASLAPRLGYAFVAIDRPGYGLAETSAMDFAAQAALLREAAAAALRSYAPDSRGVVVVGHSIGAMLAMLMAADTEADYLGLDLNGAGFTYRPQAKQTLAQYVALPDPPRGPNKAARLARMFGPGETFAQRVADEDFEAAPLSQPTEIKEAFGWEARVVDVAPRIKCPVNFSISEFDALWDSSQSTLDGMRRLFSSSVAAETFVQRRAGHCTHLHKIARAFNLRTLAFADMCIAGGR
jgi:pimeloyl-ACP methyl ester carboxylesterase